MDDLYLSILRFINFEQLPKSRSKLARSITATFKDPTALTFAVRFAFPNNARSPKYSPAGILLTSTSFFFLFLNIT